jgi:hypothetical protein
MWGSGATSALDGEERSASRPGRFTHGEGARGAHWIGDRSARPGEETDLALPGI